MDDRREIGGISGVGYWHMCRMSSRSCVHVSYLMVCLRAFVTSLQEHPRLLTHDGGRVPRDANTTLRLFDRLAIDPAPREHVLNR